MKILTKKTVFEGQRSVIAAIFVASFFVNLLALTAPLYMLQLFSRVLSSGSTATLVVLTLGALVALSFFFFFDMIRQRLASRLGTRLEDGHGPTVMSVLVQAASAEDRRGTQPMRDLHEIRRFVTGPAFIALLDAPWSIVFVGIMFLFHPALGFVSVAGIAILFALGVLSEYHGRKPQRESDENSYAANAIADEMVRNADVVRAMGKTDTMIARWKMRSNSSLNAGTAVVERLALYSSAARFVRLILQIAVLATGVSLVLQGVLSPGVMIAASILLGKAAAPVEQAISGWRAMLSAGQARNRLNTLLAGIDAGAEQLELPEPDGRLAVENATFVAPNRQDPLIFDVSFSLKPGDMMGIIGPSGSGKTTLARALVGLQPLSRGHVRIDDASLVDWPQAQIGQYIGFLPQRIELFDGTIAENIASMERDVDAGAVVEAAKRAEVHNLILSLPGGYNANVGLRGELLSAGQRQRIGLARAFFGQKRLIVLDEPNANLDPEGEEALARAVQNAAETGAVVIVVTHRTGILQRMTHAGLMVNGRMAKFGTARDILKASAQPMAPHQTFDDPKVTELAHRRPARKTAASAATAGGQPT